MSLVIIIDYGIGNIGSIIKMINKTGNTAEYTSEKSKIENATHLILPGVGSFDRGIKGLQEKNIIPTIEKKIFDDKTPLLGICLGMQMMMENSEEGKENGLSWIKGDVVRFSQSSGIKVPHMGWNDVTPKNTETIFKKLDNPRFYFIHSYYVRCKKEEDISAKTTYGSVFTSAVSKDNVYGVQFHPEKSHKYGLQLLKNFLEL